jgi:hypothetical protein
LAATKHWRRQRILAPTKYWCRQNVGVNKMFASTKCWRPQTIHVDKILASTKYWRRQNLGADKNVGACAEASPYCFGPAESAAADFSQTSLMFSDFSQKVLIPPRAVTKCAVAAGHPAVMGALSPALYWLMYRHAMQKTSQILTLTKYRRPPRFH